LVAAAGAAIAAANAAGAIGVGAIGTGAGLRIGSLCGLIGSPCGLKFAGSSFLLFHTWVSFLLKECLVRHSQHLEGQLLYV
jgi:hypothetical protein